jgi:hypothetical protein
MPLARGAFEKSCGSGAFFRGFAIQPSNMPMKSGSGPDTARVTLGSTTISADGSWDGLVRPMPSPGARRNWTGDTSLQFRPVDLTGIFTVFCLIAADLGNVIFKIPLEKSVFTDLGSGSNGRVIERANLPNVRS